MLRLRCTPVAQKLVAEEVFEISLFPHDGGCLDLEDLVEEVEHALRSEDFSQRGGVAKVGEQQGDVGVFGLHGARVGEHGLQDGGGEVQPHGVAQFDPVYALLKEVVKENQKPADQEGQDGGRDGNDPAGPVVKPLGKYPVADHAHEQGAEPFHGLEVVK